MSLFQAIKAFVKANPTIHVKDIAKKFNITVERAAIYILWVYYGKD